jgi:hypothetical protein
MRRNLLYALFGIVVLAVYAHNDLRGREFPTTRRTVAPQSMRGAHGGRSFWYSGYHGGK